MAEQIPAPNGFETSAGAGAGSEARISSGAVAAAGRDDPMDAILVRGDLRDQAAERRDRRADLRFGATSEGQAGIDRDWAARDRDAAATDRSDLVVLLRARPAAPGVSELAPSVVPERGHD